MWRVSVSSTTVTLGSVHSDPRVTDPDSRHWGWMTTSFETRVWVRISHPEGMGRHVMTSVSMTTMRVPDAVFSVFWLTDPDTHHWYGGDCRTGCTNSNVHFSFQGELETRRDTVTTVVLTRSDFRRTDPDTHRWGVTSVVVVVTHEGSVVVVVTHAVMMTVVGVVWSTGP